MILEGVTNERLFFSRQEHLQYPHLARGNVVCRGRGVLWYSVVLTQNTNSDGNNQVPNVLH